MHCSSKIASNRHGYTTYRYVASSWNVGLNSCRKNGARKQRHGKKKSHDKIWTRAEKCIPKELLTSLNQS